MRSRRCISSSATSTTSRVRERWRCSRRALGKQRSLKEIDFVYAAPKTQLDVGEVRVVDERMGSDHRPVLAVLGLRPVAQ